MTGVNEEDRQSAASSGLYPQVFEVNAMSLNSPPRGRVRRVNFHQSLNCLLFTEPDELLARLIWCVNWGLADEVNRTVSFQKALVSSEKFCRFEDFIKLNNGAVHVPKLSADFTLFGFEVHTSALSLAATKFLEILEAVELAPVAGQSISIENDSALTPENEALAALLGPEHRFSKFMNAFSAPIALQDDGLSQWARELLSTRQHALIVSGAQDLDQLTVTANRFSRVFAGKCAERGTDGHSTQILDSVRSLRKVVVICSAGLPRLVATWLLPASPPNSYRCKPFNYLAYLIQQEDSGGLFCTLREQQLITDIQVVLPEEELEASRRWNVFRVIFTLTSKGVERKERTVSALLDYLSYIRGNAVHEWIHREAAMSCRLKYESSSLRHLLGKKTLCRAVLDYAPEDCVEGPHLMTEFHEQLIVDLIADLLRREFNVILEGDFDVSAFPEAEAHPSVGLILRMPEAEAEKWTFSEYTMNEFMPRSLSLRQERRYLENYPNVIWKTGSHRLWFQYRNLNSPKVHCFLHFARDVGRSADWFLSAELACAILERTLYSRKASEAGVEFYCSVTDSGITFSILAMNDSVLPFAEQLRRRIQGANIPPSLFKECHADLTESYRMRTTNAGYAENIFGQMHSGELDLQERIEAARRVTSEKVGLVFRDIEHNLFQEAFIYGNYSADDALNVVRLFDAFAPFQVSAVPSRSLGHRPVFEDRSHPGLASDPAGILLLYYHFGEDGTPDKEPFLEILTDYLNSKLQISEGAIYCMPRSRAGQTTGFTVEVCGDRAALTRSCSLAEKSLRRIVSELSNDPNETEDLLMTVKKHFKRRRELFYPGNSSCYLMTKEANRHLNEILNETFCFGRCFDDDQNPINCLEARNFDSWLQQSIACGYLKKPVCRIRVGQLP